MSMKTKAPRWIFNEWWAEGIPLGVPGGASGSTADLPVSVRTIAGVTPVMIDGTQGVAVKTIGGATPTFTGGAQHMILTNASIQVDVYGAEVTTIGGATPAMIAGQQQVGVGTLGGATPLLTIGAQHVTVKTIGGATPLLTTGAQHVAIETIASVTPTLTGGAQHFVLTGASTTDGHYLGDIKFGEALPAGTADLGDILNLHMIGGATPTMLGGAQLVYQTGLQHQTVALAAITLLAIDTEYGYGLPANCRAIRFQCRTADDIRFAWVTGKVATPTDPYQTLKSGDVYTMEHMKLTGATLHMASAGTSKYVEIETWV